MSKELILHIEKFTDAAEFERLCCDVLSVIGYKGIDPQGIGNIDGGKDAVLIDPNHGKIIFHFSLRKDWKNKLKEDITKVKKNKLECDEFVFVTNRHVKPSEKDSLKLLCKEELNANLEIYCQERIRIVLTGEKHLCSQYFPNFYFTSDILESIVDLLHSSNDTKLRIPASNQIKNYSNITKDILSEISELVFQNKPEDAYSLSESFILETTKMNQEIANIFCIAGCLCFVSEKHLLAKKFWELSIQSFADHFASNFNLAIWYEYNANKRRYGYGFNFNVSLHYYEKSFLLCTNDQERADCCDNQGVVFLKINELDKAKEKFLEAQKFDSTHNSSKMNLATISTNTVEKEKIYKSLLDSDIDDLVKINLASLYADNKIWKEAILYLRKFTIRDKYVESYHILCVMAFRRENVRNAKSYAVKAIEKDYYHYKGHLLLAKIYKYLNNFESAKVCYQTAIELNPLIWEPYFDLAEILSTQKNRKELNLAIEYLHKVLRIDPDIINIHNKIGTIYIDLGMFASARVEFQLEIEKYPQNHISYFNLGYLCEIGSDGQQYGRGCDLQTAISYYKKALDIDANYIPALFNSGTNLLILRKYNEAIKYFERALQLDIKNDMLLPNLALAYYRIGMKDKSITLLEKALDLNPKNTYASENLKSLVSNHNA